jgi:mRNA interferase RelE/StbE
MYELKIIPLAQKDLNQLRGKIFNKIKNEILNLAKNPHAFGCIKLTAEDGYRVSLGDYRILYRIDDKLRVVFIYRIKHRKDAYG